MSQQRDEQQSDDIQEEALPARNIFNSKWAVWVTIFVAILLLCATATVAFALRQRTKTPVTYSPMTQLESQYDMADMQVTSSNGLGVDAGSTPVVTPNNTNAANPAAQGQTSAVAGANTGTQTAAPKIGPAPTAAETNPLQPVADPMGNNALTLQAGAGLQNGSNSTNVLNGTVNVNLNQ